MEESRIQIASCDGTSLCAVIVKPAQPTKGIVVLAHGITVEKDEDGFYTRLAKVLAEGALQSLRFDFRGHGESGGNPEDMTIHGEVEDLMAVVNHLRQAGWNRVAIVGTSFGAGVAVLYARREPNTVSSLALLSPVLDYKRTFLVPETEWAKEWFTKEALKRAQRTGKLDLDGFPLGLKLLKEFRTLNPAQDLLSLTVPTLIIHGTEDTMVPYDVAKNAASQYRLGTFRPIEGADHGFEGFEERVFSEVREWILAHLAV